jgi:hypothetical protein
MRGSTANGAWVLRAGAVWEDEMPCSNPTSGEFDEEVTAALLRHSDRADWAYEILSTLALPAEDDVEPAVP